MTRQGYSLVEILVASALFGIVCLGIISVYRVGLQTESLTAQRSKLQSNLLLGMHAMEKDIADATASLGTSTGNKLDILVPVYNAAGVPVGVNDAITFQASGTALYQTVTPGVGSTRQGYTNKRLIQNMPSPYPTPGLFTYFTRTNGSLGTASAPAATLVRISLFQSAKYGRRTQTVDLVQDIRMRNR